MNTKSNIEKKLIPGGPDTKRLNMDEFIKLADKETIERDVELEILRQLEEKFKNDGKPGETFLDFIKRTPREELIKLELNKGGRVINFLDYAKSKSPDVKKIDLVGQFTPEKTLSNLTTKEREAVNMLLKLTLGKTNE